jgi:hypothetical protein
MIPTKFLFIWQSRFRDEDFLEIKSVKNRKLLKELDFSPLKPFGQMNRNLVGCIYGRFSIRIAHFVPIINKHGRHKQLLSLIGQFLKIFYSETW